jgi:hypothetical protein
MKPNPKSKYFKISLACFAAYLVTLVVLRFYVVHAVRSGNSFTLLINALFWASVLWVSLGSLFWFKTTKNKQNAMNHVAAFLLGPVVLSPIIGFLYVLVVLMPIYSLVGSTLIK